MWQIAEPETWQRKCLQLISRPPGYLGASLMDSRNTVIQAGLVGNEQDDYAWVVRVARRYPDEPIQDYIWRAFCLAHNMRLLVQSGPVPYLPEAGRICHVFSSHLEPLRDLVNLDTLVGDRLADTDRELSGTALELSDAELEQVINDSGLSKPAWVMGYAIPYCPGRPLSVYLRRGHRLTVKQIADLALEVARFLAALHARGWGFCAWEWEHFILDSAHRLKGILGYSHFQRLRAFDIDWVSRDIQWFGQWLQVLLGNLCLPAGDAHRRGVLWRVANIALQGRQRGFTSSREVYEELTVAAGDVVAVRVGSESCTRVGVFIDTANVLTSLGGWFIDFAEVLRSMVSYNEGWKVVRAVAVVPVPEGGSRDRLIQRLLQMGLEVEEVPVPATGAEQLDDQVLQQLISRAIRDIDVLVLLTGDHHFVPVLRWVKEQQVSTTVVAFGDAAESLREFNLVDGMRRFHRCIDITRRFTESRYSNRESSEV